MTEQELTEALADKEHASWARWMEWLFRCCQEQPDGSMLIPRDRVQRWQWEIKTPYADLPDYLQQFDRNEVERILPIIRRHVAEGVSQGETTRRP